MGLRLVAQIGYGQVLERIPLTAGVAGRVARTHKTAYIRNVAREPDFLAAVPRGDWQVFDNFFADDVIYTRSAGVTVNKAEIMKNIDVRGTNEPSATYEADDITVHAYGDNLAIVNFRLVMHTTKEGKQQTAHLRNSGTFLKRNGKWQVVAWQATKIPPPEEKK